MHLTILAWFDSRVGSKACSTLAANMCILNFNHPTLYPRKYAWHSCTFYGLEFQAVEY